MKGGHLLLFDKPNKFFRDHGGVYTYTSGPFTFEYTGHSYKHLDAWIPIGHPFWDLYSASFFGASAPAESVREQLDEFHAMCDPFIHTMINQFIAGAAPNFFRVHGVPTAIPHQSRFRNNNIEIVAIVNADDTITIMHISPMDTSVGAKYQAAYNAAQPNVSSVKWVHEKYIDPTWQDIDPSSPIAKAAYEEEVARHAVTVGFDFCQIVYKNAQARLVLDKAAQKKIADALKVAKATAVGNETKKLLEGHVVEDVSPLKEEDFDRLKDEVEKGPGKNDAEYTKNVGYLLKKIELPHKYRSSMASKTHKKKFLEELKKLKREYLRSVGGPKYTKDRRKKDKDSQTSSQEAASQEEGSPQEAASQEEVSSQEAASQEEEFEPTKAEGKRRKTKKSNPKRRTKRQTRKPRKSTLRARRRTRVV